MIPIEKLEIRMSSVIRSGMRRAMAEINITYLDDPLYYVLESLESMLFNSLYRQVVQTYSEGYVAAGALRAEGMVSAAVSLPVREDPRIAKATKAVVYGVKGSMAGHKNEIQAMIRSGYEQGMTHSQLSARLGHYFDDNPASAERFARTATNDIYNRAALDRYEDSGVVDGVEFSAHIDDRTSAICTMLNGTIWALGDSGIQVPPMHHNCRSRLKPYWGSIPSKRDFNKEFGSDYVVDAMKVTDTFRSKYWSPMPHTKASATYQRTYFTKPDIKRIIEGLNQNIKTERLKGILGDVVPLERLKALIRYRKYDPDKSMIADRFGKSLLLDRFEERDITKAIKALITRTEGRILREAAKRKKIIDSAWKDVITARKGIASLEKDILYYTKRMKSDPANAAAYKQIIAADMKRLDTFKAAELNRVDKWNKTVSMEPSVKTITLEAEKERYEDILKGFQFQERS